MNAYVEEILSPAGRIVFATDGGGALLGLRFRDGRRGASLERDLRREGFDVEYEESGKSSSASLVREQLLEYFAGERRVFDLEVESRGSEFERAVWEELSRIPFGETRTYGWVAEAVGGGASAVEVGKACAANPVLLVVPCHRVVSADGSLRGYAAGLPVKVRLLDFEEARQKRLFV